MKLCRDCKYYDGYGYCYYAAESSINPVTGEVQRNGEKRASQERVLSVDGCTVSARYYKRKWWKFWRPK